MLEQFHDNRVTVVAGDCLTVLASAPENFVDACVTDPPYGLEFMGKGWDRGVPPVAYWSLIYRVLKPGAHLVAFGGTRTSHRMVCAIEDAGFEIRDSLCWLYGTGFPKSHDVSKGIDKAAGAERERVAPRSVIAHQRNIGNVRPYMSDPNHTTVSDIPATDAARQWEGWGTALKPAFEPIVLARKPLSEPTVAANVLKWGTGAINVDGCRVDGAVTTNPLVRNAKGFRSRGLIQGRIENGSVNSVGRWPANVVHDGSDEVVGAFPTTGPAKAGKRNAPKIGGTFGDYAGDEPERLGHTDAGGSAARFFYSAKASKADRAGSKHPTIKPIALMQWLCRLITPPGGLVLDPFAGSGTTGQAALNEGMRAFLIEREQEYVLDIRRRMTGDLTDAGLVLDRGAPRQVG